MELTAAGIGVVVFFAALAAMHKKMWKTAVPRMMLVAGGLVTFGLVGRAARWVAETAVSAAGSVTVALVGASATAVVAVVVFIFIYPHLKRHGQPPTAFTPWLAFVFVPILVATGGLLADVAVFGTTTFADIGTAPKVAANEAIQGASQS